MAAPTCGWGAGFIALCLNSLLTLILAVSLFLTSFLYLFSFFFYRTIKYQGMAKARPATHDNAAARGDAAFSSCFFSSFGVPGLTWTISISEQSTPRSG
ncbi:hypothetical protein Micbo1qcDRAFT_54157 [Microdochium bolleyi]|uniref:Uncharacterized protein n=1 Tax=Microdochium bolleyi TaxID=196109 RepID=A0A136J7V4_9PEZI|nr:hypothetical protein Micbo1qcDRAFT_54157 [Microdochium bolleyi]